MNPNIFAVVVTYNRLAFLQKVIQALHEQTKPLRRIIIVNNGSTDGTAEWLDRQSEIKVIHQENKGGSGGFSTGIKTALEESADWIWLMDDDVQPEKECLENLLVYAGISECIHPVRFDAEKEFAEEERWFDPVSCTISNHFNASFNHGKKYWFRNIGSFEGMLISRRIINNIGLPDKRFFLMHDDLIYGFLAHQHTNVMVVADAVMYKLQSIKSEASLYAGLYYKFRNLWLIEDYCNEIVKGFTAYRKRRIRWQFWYELYKIVRLGEYPDKWRAVTTLFKAYQHYKQKKWGKAD